MRSPLIAAFVPLVASAAIASAQGAPPSPPTPASPSNPVVSSPGSPPPAAPASPTAPSPASAVPAAPGAPATTPTPPVPPAALTAAQVDRDAALRIGRTVAGWANIGAVDSLVALADPAVGAPATVREKLEAGLADFAAQLGAETKVQEERIMLVNGRVQYWRTAEFSAVPISVVFRVMIGEGGKWRGFTVTPADQLPPGEEVKP